MNSINSEKNKQPLSALGRPTNIENYIGQDHLLGPNAPLSYLIKNKDIHSLILWGPPGVGKTTLAKIMAQSINAHFESISAVFSGVKDIRKIIESATLNQQQYNQRTILFIDEVHRFNKIQQDILLPYIEDGTFTFIGATTENPSFEINNALLSRLQVYVLRSLKEPDLKKIIQNALEHGYQNKKIELEIDALNKLISLSEGDARRALNYLEIIIGFANHKAKISLSELIDILPEAIQQFDKKGDFFYDLTSALHKSIRGSNPDASLFWFSRMITSGCDPLYIARRLIRIASEDIGNADPKALSLCMDAWSVQERLGSPEGELSLAQAVTYLACAPKSNAVYKAYHLSKKDSSKYSSLNVPLHLRNAPTKLMKQLHYKKYYRYAHDEPYAYAAGENYFPDGMQKTQYYFPTNRGLEKKISEKLNFLSDLDFNYKTKKY